MKGLFEEAAAASQPKSRAVFSIEAPGYLDEFWEEMNRYQSERGGKGITVESIKRIHIHHREFRVLS